MKFYMAAGRLAPTQAAAKERDKNFVDHEVPTDKEGLMAYVNSLLDRVDNAGRPDGSGAAEEGSTPSPPPPVAEQSTRAPAAKLPDEAEARRKMVAMLQGMRTDEIETRILEAKGNDFGRMLTAAIDRLGELREQGFNAFRALADHGPNKVKSVPMYGASTERGLRYLTLAQIEAMTPADEATRTPEQDAA